MFIFHASDYASRSDLETAVRNKFGLTTSSKKAQIHGLSDDLKRLSLGPDAIFWAIPCIQTNPIDLESQGSPNGQQLAMPALGGKKKLLKPAKRAKKAIKKSKKK